MKKKIGLVYTTALALCWMTGCSSGSVTSDFMNKLEEHARHNTSYIKAEQQSSEINMEAAVDGSEEETIVKVLTDANIMNKPSDDGTVVGQVKSDESVLLIGENSVGGWYKVAYNGRVCYVKGTSLDMQTYVADNDNVNNGDTNRPTTTTQAARPGNNGQTTSTNPNQSSSSQTTSYVGPSHSTGGNQDETTTTGNQNMSSTGGSTQPSAGDETTTPSGSNPGGEETTTPPDTTTGGNEPSSDTTVTPPETDTSETETTTEPESPSEEETTTPETPSESQTSEDVQPQPQPDPWGGEY